MRVTVTVQALGPSDGATYRVGRDIAHAVRRVVQAQLGSRDRELGPGELATSIEPCANEDGGTPGVNVGITQVSRLHRNNELLQETVDQCVEATRPHCPYGTNILVHMDVGPDAEGRCAEFEACTVKLEASA